MPLILIKIPQNEAFHCNYYALITNIKMHLNRLLQTKSGSAAIFPVKNCYFRDQPDLITWLHDEEEASCFSQLQQNHCSMLSHFLFVSAQQSCRNPSGFYMKTCTWCPADSLISQPVCVRLLSEVWTKGFCVLRTEIQRKAQFNQFMFLYLIIFLATSCGETEELQHSFGYDLKLMKSELNYIYIYFTCFHVFFYTRVHLSYTSVSV